MIVSFSVGQVVNLRRIANPPAAGAAECLGISTRIGRRIANPPQDAILPHKNKNTLT
jgi:hypothetical protein